MTRPIIRTLIASLTLTTLAATAAAQPGADNEIPPPAPVATPVAVTAAAPLSQINGMPIKVGEHNQYYYSFPKWNVSTNPFGIITGLYNVSASYAMSERVALRGDINVFAGGELLNESGFEFGIGAPIYFKKMYNGFFLEPGLIVRELRSNYGDDYHDDGNTDRTVGPQILAGWHWTWDSGLNVALAFGMGRDLVTNDDDYYDEGVFANGYFRVGYAF